MLEQIVQLISRYGLGLVFANVLIEQIGLPLPAVPTMIVAGALAAEGKLSAAAILGVAAVASAIADIVWYWLGRRFGNKVMKFLCRISLSPDTCVNQSEIRFERWGGSLLLVAKFVPGLSTVAPPLAGAMKLGWASFLFFNTLGTMLWAGAAIGAGLLFHRQIAELFAALERMGTIAGFLVGGVFAAYVAFKYWQRRRLYRRLRMARITVDQLYQLMEAGHEPVVVDVRSPTARALDPRSIPGALPVDIDQVDAWIGHLPKDGEIILYCTCPNDASAARVAKILIDLGYQRVRPLLGGLDAWAEAGYAVHHDLAHAAVLRRPD